MTQIDTSHFQKKTTEDLLQILTVDYNNYRADVLNFVAEELKSRGEQVDAQHIIFMREQEAKIKAIRDEEELISASETPLGNGTRVAFFLFPVISFFYWVFRDRKWKARRKEAILLSLAGFLFRGIAMWFLADMPA